MKKIILFILFFLGVFIVYSQDTVSENSPWYMFKSHGNLWYMIHEKPLPTIGHGIFQYYGKDSGDIYVYGVAVTLNYVPVEEERRNEAVTMTPTFMVLDHVAHGDPPLVSFLDSTNVLGKVQQCRFEYVLSDSNSVTPCYEFYFDNPHHFVAPDDTFYVSLYWPEERATRYTAWWHNEALSSWDYYMYMRYPILENYIFPELWTTGSDAGMFDFAPHYSVPMYRCWGTIFPIVQLRCTAPYLSMEGHEGDATTVRWWQAEAGESYQVALGAYGSSPESATVVATTDTFHTFTGLQADSIYSAWVRKACRYTTTGYDTLVWSDWSRPLVFRTAVGIGEVDDFTLQVASREGCIVVSGLTAGERVEVYDMLGRRVAALMADGVTAPLPAGLYLVRTTAHSRARRVAVLR
jgi:hypothetical protein